MRLRVAVLGNSVALVVEPPRADRTEGTYLDHLLRLLGAAGRDAEVRNAARWYCLLTDALDDYEEYVRAYSPDVLVVQFGLNDLVPRALPIALHRHLFTWDEHARQRAYKRFLRRRVWPPLRAYQRAFARVVGQRTWRVRPHRYADELRYLVEMARRDTGCLVLVLDVLPADDKVEHWIPGVRQRRELLNRTMRQVVDALGDDLVRYVDTSAAVAHLGAAAVPDGLHLSDAGHRVVAELVAREILGTVTT